MNLFINFLLLLLSVTSFSQALPYIHNTVKRELEKGNEAVIMVSFEAAEVDSANDPEKVLSSMKRKGLVPSEMMLDEFINEGYYANLRGEYVYRRVKSKHTKTRKLLKSIIPDAMILQSIPISNLFLLRNTAGAFDLLKDREDVVEINTDQKFNVDLDKKDAHSKLAARMNLNRLKQLVTRQSSEAQAQWNIRQIGADSVWKSGTRGQGIIVGIADTGASFTHPSLAGNYMGLKAEGRYDHNYSWWDAIRKTMPLAGKSTCPAASREPCDDNGHGTHCLSTAAGAGGYGVAPGAKWIGCRNMDMGLGSTLSYLSCLNFFLAPHDLDGNDPKPSLRPHVVNNSWGCPEYEGCSKHAMTAAVNILRAAGVFMSASAGNNGPECETIIYPPSYEANIISTGAVDIEDKLASFSSRGPVRIDGFVYRKPDIVAPGVGILGAHLSGGYRKMSGTSMASPHVAGAVALIISNCPCLNRDVNRIQAILESTAKKLYPDASLKLGGKFCGEDTPETYPNNYYGYGRINVMDAVETCRAYCSDKPNNTSALRIAIESF